MVAKVYIFLREGGESIYSNCLISGNITYNQ